MGDRAAKDALLEQFAAVGKALGSPKRLELLDLLAQSPRSVEDRAGAAGLGLSTCSANLQTLRSAGLVETRRAGKKVYYSLAGQDVAALWDALRSVLQRHRPHTELARLSYLGPDDTQEVDTKELMRRLADGGVLVLDVRPRHGYDSGHIPGAFSVPVEELEQRFAELPADIEVVAYCRGAYCVLAYDAVQLLTLHGRSARRLREGMLEWRLAGMPVQSGVA